jgi:glutaredoxin
MRKQALRFLLIVLAGSMSPGLAVSEIYRWVDEDGKVHFSDKPSHSHTSEVVKLRINTYEGVTYGTSGIDVGKKVVMYSASWCRVCKQARRYFEENGIRFAEYDVETSEQGKSGFQELGAKGVPVILVGNRRMNGFSIDGFERLYH